MKRVLTAISIFFTACTGSTGPAGPAGMNGSDGMNGMNGSNGNDIILSARAKLGLDIAAKDGVTLNLTGLDGAGIEAVGIGSYWVNAVSSCADLSTIQVQSMRLSLLSRPRTNTASPFASARSAAVVATMI